MDFATLSI